MSSIESSAEPSGPDYEWEDLRIVASTAELSALFHPLRGELVDLLLERAATVRELAAAVERPPSTVAYHVDRLVDAGLLRVVRTRRVRAIEERFYGRTARIFYVGDIGPDQLALIPNVLSTAAAESSSAHHDDDLRAMLRYARIPDDRVDTFWQRVMDLVAEFSAMPRTGTRDYGFVTGLYPTDRRAALAPPAS
ncbi:ArsR/SmtB family transcription factor [Microbacterium ulmi]|uniref:Winged helix-turn-helix transcriptional regulator n=1 Tax=Microbacterium ulmi TaxID=179095 RepID=A0A7Y2LYV1_9MICO|nr:winged helix-turn-helix domain-containing protein [Microbacterium ulmi]NII68392.1 DNA-binding transcriptional ArsR family regulator [Microbacterium ulmi]NNH03077.1 winged helix-turn-helix transcriptional regulator [Microbacterium ulmi]